MFAIASKQLAVMESLLIIPECTVAAAYAITEQYSSLRALLAAWDQCVVENKDPRLLLHETVVITHHKAFPDEMRFWINRHIRLLTFFADEDDAKPESLPKKLSAILYRAFGDENETDLYCDDF